MDKTGRLAALLPDEGDAALVLTPHNRRYLTGFPSSAGWLVVSRKGAWFFTDFRYIEAAKMRVNGAECRMITRVAESLSALFAEAGIRRVFVESGLTLGEFDALKRDIPGVDWQGGAELEGWMGSLRLCKTPEELARIRQAQALTEYGFEHILPFIRAGRTEREIALELEFLIRKQGAEGTAFDFIVVSGPNSSLPHGVPGERVLQDGDFVTMDFGAMVDGWRADTTRTVAIGRVSAEQRRVYDTVLEAQAACLSVLRAGLPCVEGDRAARDVIDRAGYTGCFGHGTGHGVGVDIHEEPRLSPGAGRTILQADSVVTVEPGIYLEGRFGVRIEDMVRITPDGCENLTNARKELICL